MKQNIWIWNHYATNTFFDRAGRHYWFAKNLIKEGYDPTLFCASTGHNSSNQIDTQGKAWTSKRVDDIPFVFVKTSDYKSNGFDRIFNMLTFYRGLYKTSREYAELNGKPDVIMASSVHPLTLLAGIRIAKKFNIPCICEVRDLWPESIVVYGSLKKDSLIGRLLYSGEKWIYKNASKLIFTIEGGRDYILDQGWDTEQGGPIDLDKVYHINNGVDLESFEANKAKFINEDEQLENKELFKVVYTGSIRTVNEIEYLLKVAKYLAEKEYNDIVFLIYGDGDDRPRLEEICKTIHLDNVIFKGKVKKEEIPYILSKSDLNIFHFKQSKLKKYGASLNKLFEYFASGKPVITDCRFGYDLIDKYGCGLIIDDATPEQLGEGIVQIKNLPPADYDQMCENSLRAAQDYDFKALTRKLIELF